jgi:uncharacterized protein YndB with AHSA1/START domain
MNGESEASSGEGRWIDEREIRVDATPETVWSAWAEPEHVERWFSDDARGKLEAGGELVHGFGTHGEHRYRVVEVERPHRLVLESDMGLGGFRQEVVIRSEGGSTVLRLVHSGFGKPDPDSEMVQGIDSGWTMALAAMKHYVEHHFGKPKRSVSIFVPARFEYDALLRDSYLGAAGLGAWLTAGEASVPEEGRVALTLRSGRALTGKVVALTDHEVSVSWDEISGLLEMKAEEWGGVYIHTYGVYVFTYDLQNHPHPPR